MCAERTTRTQIAQLSYETVAGSYSSATSYKRMTAMAIEPSIQAEVQTFKPSGYKYPTLTAVNREWTEADISGEPTYTEIVYPLSSIVSSISPAQQAGTSAYKWTFTSSTSSEDTPATFSVQHGSSVRADRFSYGIVTNLGLTGDRSDFELTGSMMGQKFTDSISLTSTYSVISLIPILPSQTCIYLDDSSGNLGNTKLTRVLSFGFNIGDRWGPLWAIDCGEDSWVVPIETDPTVTYQIVLEANVQGMGRLSDMRNGTRKWLRHQSTGSTINQTYSYTFTLDMPVEVTEVQEFSDEDGVYAIGYTLTAMDDDTWGKAYQIEVINDLSTL